MVSDRSEGGTEPSTTMIFSLATAVLLNSRSKGREVTYRQKQENIVPEFTKVSHADGNYQQGQVPQLTHDSMSSHLLTFI